MEYLKLFLFLAFAASVSGTGPDPVVRVAHGQLQGIWRESTRHGRKFASFLGVPYARPPVGKYRFREPQSLKPWLGVWDASKTLSVCLQYEPFEKRIVGDENCLFLNIHTPRLDTSALLPVVVWVHGGAFMYGAGSLYDAQHLMDRDVVVVTLNYRLGPLGFLSTGDGVVPGNAGLKDQAFALKWIQENIKMFGGDPHSVTLTGCSAGGASVHYHYLSPLSKDTFNRGIAFSGSAFASWTHTVKPLQKAKALAAIVGCPTTSTKEMADCLRYRPAEQVVNAQIEMFDWRVHMFTVFTPTAELNSKGAFLTQYPYHAATAGAMHHLPLITSVTSEEGLYPAACYQTEPDLLDDLESRWSHLASNIFEYNDTLPLDRRAAVADKIKEHYLGGRPVSQETFPELVQALGDRLFVVGVGMNARLHAAKTGQPTYLYRYSHRGQHSLSEMMAGNDNNYGVSHGDDTFEIYKAMWSSESPEDVDMREALLDMVYSYASTGVPKLPGAAEWQQVDPAAPELRYLEIAGADSIQMKSSADFGQKTFWDSLGFIENENFNVKIRDEL
ncbi:venom carboxylesterase-6-like [Aricia agestis]|uniref:venom carboxylesterase-6-like n=1 Tax=Aricia agestis TaxID=91739 RepID=UPI001C20B35E|nr:venom carboxylesterase-6-like [Aricia agestis]